MFVLYSKACLCFKKRILIVFSGWLAVVTQFSIHTNLCSVSVAVMEPQFCLSSSLVRRKECLSPGIWLKGACWPISCPVSGTTGSPNTQTVSVSPFFFHLTGKLHITFPQSQRRRRLGGNKRFSSKACLLWWRCQCVISGANCLTLDHLQSLFHHDSSPMILLLCKLKALCILLTVHSVTS